MFGLFMVYQISWMFCVKNFLDLMFSLMNRFALEYLQHLRLSFSSLVLCWLCMPLQFPFIYPDFPFPEFLWFVFSSLSLYHLQVLNCLLHLFYCFFFLVFLGFFERFIDFFQFFVCLFLHFFKGIFQFPLQGPQTFS